MTNKPLAHMVTVDATGLQETSPVRSENDSFEDTPTSLNVKRATPATPLYARLTARLEPVGGPTLDGASWIWTSSDPEWYVTRYFRKSLTLDEVPSTAQFVFAGDDRATVHVNGEQVAQSDNWSHGPVIDVSDALTTGENALAVEVEQGTYGAGLVGRLELGEDRVVVTDDSWLGAENVSGEWTAVDFDDSEWSSAVVLAEFGSGDWGGNIDIEDSQEGAARVALSDPSGRDVQYTDPVTVDDDVGIRSTGWVKVPADFNGGTARLQVSNARVTVVTLELAVRNDI